jgi:hypothetical protein
MNRIDLMSSSFLSFLLCANPEKGDPNSGMNILLSWFLSDFLPNAPAHGRRVSYAPWSR